MVRELHVSEEVSTLMHIALMIQILHTVSSLVGAVKDDPKLMKLLGQIVDRVHRTVSSGS